MVTRVISSFVRTINRLAAFGKHTPLKDSAAAKRKKARHKTDEDGPVTSWRDLLRHLASLTLNSVVTPINPSYSFTVIATATELQDRAFKLLGVKPIRVQ